MSTSRTFPQERFPTPFSNAPWYTGGFNPRAVIALAVGIAPCGPGFLGTIGAMEVAPVWMAMYNYAWFISLALSAVSYLLL